MEYNLANLEKIITENRKDIKQIKEFVKGIMKNDICNDYNILNIHGFKVIREKSFIITDKDFESSGSKTSVYTSIKSMVEREQPKFIHRNKYRGFKENERMLIIEEIDKKHYLSLYCNSIVVDFIADILNVEMEHETKFNILNSYLVRYGYLIEKENDRKATYILVNNNENKMIKGKDINELFEVINSFKERKGKEIEVIINVNNKRFAYYCELKNF